MAGFEKFKMALKKAEEQKYEELQKDLKKVRNVVEKILTMAMENTANVARTKYAGLEMF
ncbi:MAG: hypothetical protein KHX03_08865 [Clostridium sp.]|nr:hypothetical protein [Clostridium sp.]